ncbi:MAG: TetR/AcrR family transcriptional regulator [Spirochaetes bacterium]|nr:TetR/AcrR family transcriptional regulator [Spirochaetota bacterium]MBN2770694.1 TetR/AcrR family transcriptional regulator [Spirochaetota bacterium]
MDKEQKIKEKKHEIINAFRSCLERDVYSNITIQNVADECGLSKGGLLHYFGAKEDLYFELVQQLCDDITAGRRSVLQGIADSNDQASLSTLYVIEQFFLDKNNIHVLLNLLLLSFEDESVREVFKKFFHENMGFFQTLIEKKYQDIPQRRKSDLPAADLARILQIIVLAAGIVELVDPVNFDHNHLTTYILSILKG